MTTSAAAAQPGPGVLRRLGPALCVSLVLIGWSLIDTMVPGVNEPHYLCKARHWFNPEWCSGDFFLESSNAHFVFYVVTGPLTELLPFAIVAVLGRVASLSLVATGWWLLSRRLGLSAISAVAAAAAFGCIATAGNFSGEWVVGGFEGKVPAYGFCLLGSALWIDAHGTVIGRKWVAAGAALGAGVAFHPVVGLWYCIGIGLTEAILIAGATFRGLRGADEQSISLARQWKTFGKQQLCLIAAAVVASLPGLIPAISLILNSPAAARDQRRALYFQVFRRLAHHLDPSRFPVRNWIHTGLVVGLIGVGLWYVRKRCLADESIDRQLTKRTSSWQLSWRLMGTLLLVAAGIGLAGVLVGWHEGRASRLSDWHQRAAFLRYYPFRFVDGLLPMVGGMTAGLLLTIVSGGRARRELVITMVLCTVLMGTAWSSRRTAPTGYTDARFDEWKNACAWIQKNTLQDAVILGPREGFGLKWYAERAEYVCYKDCPQDARGIVEWDRRLRLTGKWKWTRRIDSRYGDGGPVLRKDVLELHRKTGATHILTRRLREFEQEPVYRNRYWRVYDIRETNEEREALEVREAAESAN